MTYEQLFGKYLRLREELIEANGASDHRARHVDRLAAELAALQLAMLGEQPQDEQTGDTIPGT